MIRVRTVDHFPGEPHIVRDWQALPEGERIEFMRAIAERAAAYRDEPIEIVPPVVLRLVHSDDA